MNNITQDTGINGRDEGFVRYFLSGGITPAETEGGIKQEPLIPIYSPTMNEEIRKEFELKYRPILLKGEVERMAPTLSKSIIEILKSSIDLVDEVLEVYDDEIERINTFSLFWGKIKSLWELRKEVNKNFVDVLVLIEVAVRNSHYQNYQKNQYQSIKKVLEKIKIVHITPQQTKECRKLLIDNGIDLFAPIRNWENYTIEIQHLAQKKNNANK